MRRLVDHVPCGDGGYQAFLRDVARFGGLPGVVCGSLRADRAFGVRTWCGDSGQWGDKMKYNIDMRGIGPIAYLPESGPLRATVLSASGRSGEVAARWAARSGPWASLIP